MQVSTNLRIQALKWYLMQKSNYSKTEKYSAKTIIFWLILASNHRKLRLQEAILYQKAISKYLLKDIFIFPK